MTFTFLLRLVVGSCRWALLRKMDNQGASSRSPEGYIQSYAYDWIAQELKLTITGEYVPPVPPEPTPEPTPIVEETIA